MSYLSGRLGTSNLLQMFSREKHLDLQFLYLAQLQLGRVSTPLDTAACSTDTWTLFCLQDFVLPCERYLLTLILSVCP